MNITLYVIYTEKKCMIFLCIFTILKRSTSFQICHLSFRKQTYGQNRYLRIFPLIMRRNISAQQMRKTLQHTFMVMIYQEKTIKGIL